MAYQRPELLLVGAAQGLVLGNAWLGDISDNRNGGRCDGVAVSRDDGVICP